MSLKKHMQLARAITIPATTIAVIIIIISGAISYTLIKRTVTEAIESQIHTVQNMFTEGIRRGVLTGDYASVFSKCKQTLEESTVVGIIVEDVSGQRLCHFEAIGSLKNLKRATSTIHFDDEQHQVAATIHIVHRNNVLSAIYYQSIILLLLALVILAIANYAMATKHSHWISKPITHLTKSLSNDTLESLAEIARTSTPTTIREVQSLYQSTERMAKNLLQSRNALAIASRHAAIGKIASQVAHDIRSPLTALRTIAGHLHELPEGKRIAVRNAVQRIDDIVNDLAERKAPTDRTDAREASASATRSIQLLSSLIEPLVSEKRLQHRDKLQLDIHATLDEASYGIFAEIQPVEFKRVLSNLVNNAVEAMGHRGTVTIDLTQSATEALITVRDTGAGIPPEILPQLMERGASFGKATGSGLGLYHARTTVAAWGGQVRLASTVGVGTTVHITIPKAPPPAWFVPALALPRDGRIIILDDDASIHQIWQARLEQLDVAGAGITVEHYSTGKELLAAYTNGQPTLFLCDYELIGEPTTGLDVIETLGVQAHAILVTSRYDEPTVRTRCAHLGVRLIPKGLAGLVPLKVLNPSSVVSRQSPVGDESPGRVFDDRRLVSDDRRPTTNDGVQVLTDDQRLATGDGVRVLVLDDDAGIRFAWGLERARLGIGELSMYASMEDCEAAAPAYADYDFAFVDKHIPQSAWALGDVILHLKNAGVKHVVVASGESPQDLASDPACATADGIASPKIPEAL